jgi:hypothetical protein
MGDDYRAPASNSRNHRKRTSYRSDGITSLDPCSLSDDPQAGSLEMDTVKKSTEDGQSKKADGFKDEATVAQSVGASSSHESARNSSVAETPTLDVLRRLHDDKPRDLNSQDVASLVINTMVGSGIYTTPPIVLLLTGSKGEAFALWVVGFLSTLVRYEPFTCSWFPFGLN